MRAVAEKEEKNTGDGIQETEWKRKKSQFSMLARTVEFIGRAKQRKRQPSAVNRQRAA
jgi:hypothetical protein